jgi:hypothetical protein
MWGNVSDGSKKMAHKEKAPASEGGRYKILDLGKTSLEREKDQVSAAADAKLVKQIGDVEFDGALGDIELAGDLFVRKIFEERIENFLFTAAEIGYGIRFQAPTLIGKDGIDKAGKQLTGNPESAAGDKRKRANELLASLSVGEQTLYAKTQKRKAVGFVVLFADDDEARFRESFQKICQQRAGSGLGGVRINDVDLSLWRLKSAQVRSERGFELLDDDLELRGL